MAGDAAFVICSAMTTVTAGRIEFSFNLVHRHEVAAMGHLTIRTVAVFKGGLHLDLIGMTVVTEGAFVTG